MKYLICLIFITVVSTLFAQDSGRLESIIDDHSARKKRLEEKQTESQQNPDAVSMKDKKSVLPNLGVGKSFFKVGVEPFKMTRIEKNRSYGIDAKLRLHDLGNYILDGSYNFNLEDEREPFSGSVITSRYNQADLSFEKEKFFGNFNYLAQAGFERERWGGVFSIYQRLYAGVIGVKYNHQNTRGFLREFSISFLPVYDSLKSDAYASDGVNLIRKDREYIRQYFQIDMTFALSKTLKAVNHFHWRPVYDLQTDEFTANNSEIEQKLTLMMEMNENFYLSYENKITWNKRHQVDLNRPTTDLVNSLKLNWRVGL